MKWVAGGRTGIHMLLCWGQWLARWGQERPRAMGWRPRAGGASSLFWHLRCQWARGLLLPEGRARRGRREAVPRGTGHHLSWHPRSSKQRNQEQLKKKDRRLQGGEGSSSWAAGLSAVGGGTSTGPATGPSGLVPAGRQPGPLRWWPQRPLCSEEKAPGGGGRLRGTLVESAAA